MIANVELSQVVQLRFGQPLTLQSHQTDGHAGGIEFQHHGRQCALRQTSQVSHCQVGNLADGGIGIGSRLEINLDQAHASQRTRFDVVDVAAQSKKAFEGVGDVAFDLLWRHAAVESSDDHNRNLNLRKQINRHPRHGGHAYNNDAEAQHQNEKRIFDGKC